MFKKLLYLFILLTLQPSLSAMSDRQVLFAMEKYPIKEGKQEIEETSRQTDFSKTSTDTEKFPWESLPKDIKAEILKNYPWEQIDKRDPEKFAESLIKSIKQYNEDAKTVNKFFYENITESYNKFLNNLTDEDFKILNKYIADSLAWLRQLPIDFNLLVKLLIKLNKLDKTAKDKINRSLRSWYVTRDVLLNSVAELIKSGADLNLQGGQGMTPLMMALNYGVYPAAELLIKAGADVNQKNDRGISPLMVASSKGNLEIVKLLLENGANINSVDVKGNTAIQYLERQTNLLNLNKSYDIYNLLKTTLERQRARRERKDCSVM